jgi:hypothetical protein
MMPTLPQTIIRRMIASSWIEYINGSLPPLAGISALCTPVVTTSGRMPAPN